MKCNVIMFHMGPQQYGRYRINFGKINFFSVNLESIKFIVFKMNHILFRSIISIKQITRLGCGVEKNHPYFEDIWVSQIH